MLDTSDSHLEIKKGENLTKNTMAIFHPHKVPMGSDFTFQIDVTTAASLMNCLLTPLMNSPTFITQGRWSERNLSSAPNFSRNAWNHETPKTTVDSAGNHDTVIMTPKEFSDPVETKSGRVCRMINSKHQRSWVLLRGPDSGTGPCTYLARFCVVNSRARNLVRS